MQKGKLLIIRFSAMGDVAMTVPVVASLAAAYPELEITVLSQPFAKAFYEGLAPNVRFMGVNVKRDYKGILGLGRLYKQLAQEGFTAVADLHGTLRARYLRLRFRLSGCATAHIDKHRAQRKQLLKSPAGEKRQLPTSFQNYSDVLAQLGLPVEIRFGSLLEKDSVQLSALSPALPARQAGERWIGIAPFAAHQGKIYPQAQMQEVVHLLLERDPHCRIFFFGFGKEEFAIIEELMAGSPRCLNASALLKGLRPEMALMSQLDVMLTMDSANMHLASLVGTRVVSIWGATHPLAGFYGYGQQAADALCLSLPCQPCSIYGNKPCRHGDWRCLAQLTPQSVAARILGEA